MYVKCSEIQASDDSFGTRIRLHLRFNNIFFNVLVHMM